MTSIIRTTQLGYRFGNGEAVLHNIELEVLTGSIFGFLGPNGAGKTTTLRLLLGLLKKQTGQIEIFGKDFDKHRIDILQKCGSLIEQPSLYGHLSARENLDIYRTIYKTPASRITEVLRLVGLSHTGSKKARQFSLGMKQRLSIAVALLPQPQLLILDEPTNGLDPNGIIEIRELIKQLNKEQGITVLVSSHILAEIEKMASHVGIIHKGKLLYQGDLQGLSSLQKGSAQLQISTSHNASATELLKTFGDSQIKKDYISIPYAGKEQAAQINKLLVENNIDVYELYTEKTNLEQLFIDITNQN